MSDLKHVLQNVMDTEFMLGGELSNSTIKKLDTFRARKYRAFLILFVTILCVVILGASLIGCYIKDLKFMLVVIGGMGGSIWGAVAMMRSVCTEWSQAEFLMILLEGADEAQVKALISKLIKRL